MLNLLAAFESFDSSAELFKNLARLLNDANDSAVAVLALEGLYRIESGVHGGQFPDQGDAIQDMRNWLRKWRCESPLGAYSGTYGRIPAFLRELTVFKTLEVPLFIDNYGKKTLLSDYPGTEDICIEESTLISHVTHCQEAKSIRKEKQFKPSDKNIMEGCWFGFDKENSVYGSNAFQTTLSKLGVTGLRQGEIVSYKKEVNVILYAVNDTDVRGLKHLGLKKPKLAPDALKEGAYVEVSIFVPSEFLPDCDRFDEVVSGPINVAHRPFCVRKKRTSYTCNEQS